MRIEPSGGLKIVIATGPQQGPAGFSVEEDVRLVRSALLYADQVELISPGALMIASLAAGAAQGPDFVFELMGTLDESTLRHLGFDGDIAQMRSTFATIKQLNDLPRAQRRKFLGADGSRRVRGMVAEMVGKFLHGEQGFEAVTSILWEQAGAPDLAVAADAGLLTLSTDAFDFGAQTGLQMEQYVETLKRLLADPHSHLMFDEQIAGIVTAMLREEQAELHPLTAEHALRAATGTGLVERLPAFPEAPMDAILEARSELAEPLVRYRKGVIDLSAKLMSGPLEPALKAEVNDLWRDEVQPTLVSLRRDLSVTRLAKDAAFNLATDAKALVSGAAGVGVFFGVGWGFHLRRTPEGRTWLVVRNRSRSGPKAIAHPFALLLGEPTHFAMQTRQFHNLRKRLPAEAGSGDSTTAHAPEAYPSPQRRHASAMGPESAMRCTASRVRQPSVCRQRSGIVTVAVTLGLPGLPADAGSRACRRPSGVR